MVTQVLAELCRAGLALPTDVLGVLRLEEAAAALEALLR